jgi:16S rRNA (cytosine1402-N4)-methyltransferase
MGAGVDQHVPVLVDQVLELLAIRADGIYIDATFGRGGHSQALLAQLGVDGRLIVLDRDEQAIRSANKLAQQDARIVVVQGSFGDIEEIAAATDIAGKVNGILADLGVSSPQLNDAERGFSFMHDGPLDMRMDRNSGESAADWINSVSESELARVIFRFGEDRAARRIARAVSESRKESSITTTRQLADLIEAVIPRRGKGKHPATKTFQAIRIHINGELDELRKFLDSALDVLAPSGRLCVISFHSLEDRMVKRYMRDLSRVDPLLADVPVVPDSAQPRLRLPAKAIRANAEEVAANPRARSAVLRVAEKFA